MRWRGRGSHEVAWAGSHEVAWAGSQRVAETHSLKETDP